MMGVREQLNRHRRITIGTVFLTVSFVVGIIVMQVLANRKTTPARLPSAFYTVDDGRTFFVANSENIPPFDYLGKPAVRAYVFECSGKRFVGYMERYTAESRKTLVETKQSTPELQIHGRELKRPGEAAWVNSGNFAAVAQVTELRCPDGGVPEPVEP